MFEYLYNPIKTIIMKKSLLLLAAVSVLAFTSCKEKTDETPDTVVVEKTTETQFVVPDTVTTESNGTTINVNKNGAEYSTKDGENKTAVEVNKDGGSVTIKK